MKILQAPSNIANQAWILAEGLRALGHEAEVWHYGPNAFDYPCDRTIEFPPKKPIDLLSPIVEALDRFDVFHFHFSRSLVPRMIGPLPGLWDLPLYRAAGKPVFFTFHGSDVRLKSLHMEVNPWSYFKYSDISSDEDDARKRLEIIRTYANAYWVCSPVNQVFVPDAGFHPRVIQIDRWPYVGPANKDVPVVAHIPSRRKTKGTDFVLKGIEQAQEQGLKFEFRLIENIPHAEVPQALAEADILVDNLLLGDYEVTGLEAMCMGKTVIARIEEQVERQMGEVPVLNADPDSFAKTLRRAVTEPDLRDELGTKGRRFVEAHHDPKVVAAKLVETYEHPPGTLPVTFPGWAAIGDARREERLEEQLIALRVALKSQKKEVVIAGLKRGPFTLIGTRIDRLIRRIVWAVRRRRS